MPAVLPNNSVHLQDGLIKDVASARHCPLGATARLRRAENRHAALWK